jgi:hypothetical protein
MKNNLHKIGPGERKKVTQITDFWDQTYDYLNPNVTKMIGHELPHIVPVVILQTRIIALGHHIMFIYFNLYYQQYTYV